MIEIKITPEGALAPYRIFELFAMELANDSSVATRYFHDISSKFATFFTSVESEAQSIVMPSCEFEKLADSAPPFPGREYVTARSIENLFIDFRSSLNDLAVQKELPPCEIIRSASEKWRDIGRISFHLAENRNASSKHAKPFVFLATYIHRLGANGTPRHLVLGTALKNYADDKTTLNGMLRPVVNAAHSSLFLKSLFESKRIFAPCEWTVQEAYNFVHDSEIFRESGISVRYSNLWKDNKVPRLKANVMLDIGKRRGGLGSDSLMRFSVNAAAGGNELSESELAAILKMPSGLIRVKGEWIEADTEKVSRLLAKWNEARDYADFAGLTFMQSLRILARVRMNDGKLPDVPVDDELVSVSSSDEFRSLATFLESSRDITLPPLPNNLDAVLRHYQKDGVLFLYRAFKLGCGVILADDMGLGKTLQTIAFLALIKNIGMLDAHSVLAVVPASLLENWKIEFNRFAPELKVAILHPSSADTFDGGAEIILTTYSMLQRGIISSESEFKIAILDEAQNIKNPSSSQSMAARSIKSAMKIALSGTPVENSLTDLWTIFDFINPGLLGTVTSFRDYLKNLETTTPKHPDYAPLARLVRPFILRRMKTDKDIATELPAKCELKAFCNLSAYQIRMYAKLVSDLAVALKEATDNQRNALVLSSLMQFKQLCNHPSQFSGNSDFDPERSGKFMRLREIATEIASRGEKVIVFTQFRELVEPLSEFLATIFACRGLILHGGVPVPERMKRVKEFQSPWGPPFFVITVKAGGTGLTLTEARHVIHFDRWWNPAVEDQATDRAHRIGQTRKVMVHKLITKGTIEEKIDSLISGKKYLANAVLNDKSGSKLIVSMSDAELIDFVKLNSADFSQ